MNNINLKINNEYGTLHTALVHNASNCVSVDELNNLYKIYGAEDDQYIKYHPEDDIWDLDKLRTQVDAYHKTLQEHGVSLIYSNTIKGAWLQFFTRDSAFVVGDTFYTTVYKKKIRQIETKGLSSLEKKLNKVIYLQTPTIEGGDVFVHNDKVFIGISRQTTIDAFKEVEKHINKQGYECIPIECDESVLHLDCRFNILSKDKAFLSTSGVTSDGIANIKKYFEIIKVNNNELKTLSTNCIIISPNKIISERRNTMINTILENIGYEVIKLDFSEPIKLWGAFRCAICPLERE